MDSTDWMKPYQDMGIVFRFNATWPAVDYSYKNPQYRIFNARLATFEGADWPQDFMTTPTTLAQNGFIYFGDREHRDRVRCAYCCVTLHSFVQTDEALFEHYRHSPNCVKLRELLAEDVSLFQAVLRHDQAKAGGPRPMIDPVFCRPCIHTLMTQESNLIVCKICLEEPIGCVFLPCTHALTCAGCAKKVDKCCLCRNPIMATCKIRLS